MQAALERLLESPSLLQPPDDLLAQLLGVIRRDALGYGSGENGRQRPRVGLARDDEQPAALETLEEVAG